MACAHRMADSQRGTTGARFRCFVTARGCLTLMWPRNAAPATSRRNSMSPTPRYFSGYESTKSRADRFPMLARRSIGAQAAPTIPCGTSVGSLTQDGWAASRRTGRHSIPAMSGRPHARRFGNATEQVAGVVFWLRRTSLICHSIFTTSSHSPIRHYGLIPITSPYSVRFATSSFIHGGI